MATWRGILFNAGTNDVRNAWWPYSSARCSFSWSACFLESEAFCQNWCQFLSWRNNGLFISCSLTTLFVEVLTFAFVRTKSNVSPCRRACRSVKYDLAVLCSTISSLIQSVLRSLCVILSSCWSSNVGGSTSVSIHVREQELELMVEHSFLLTAFRFLLSHLSMAPHRVVPNSFPLHQHLSWNKRFNFSTFIRYLASGMNFGDLEFYFKVSQKTSVYSAGNMQSHLECLAVSWNARTKQGNVVEKIRWIL
jgi:hypothetical protein